MSATSPNLPLDRRRMIKTIIVVALLSILAALVYYTFINLYERYDETVDLGWSREAQINPFLAAQYFLSETGMDVESSTKLEALEELGSNGVLVIFNANSVLNQRSAQRVVEWMQSGGRVVVAPEAFGEESEEDVLLSKFNVTKNWVNDGYFESYSDVEFDESGFVIDDEDADKVGNRDKNSRPDGQENQIDKTADENSERKSGFDRIIEELEETNREIRERRRLDELNRQAAQEQWQVDEKIRRREAWSIGDNLVRVKFESSDYPLRVDFSGSGSLYHPALYKNEYREDFNDEAQTDDYPFEDASEEYENYQENYDQQYIAQDDEYAPFYWAGNDVAVGLMQFEVGEGLLTVMADVNVFTSSQIGVFDHALLLKILTADASKVTFLFGTDVPHLFELIWQHFFEACVALLLLLLLWIVYRFRRFGPIKSSVDVNRRSFQEHISAVGEYFWRHKLRDKLLDSVRAEVWTQMRKQNPGFEQLDSEQKLQKLAEVVERDLDEIRNIMTSAVSRDEIYFFHQVKSLQRLRKQL